LFADSGHLSSFAKATEDTVSPAENKTTRLFYLSAESRLFIYYRYELVIFFALYPTFRLLGSTWAPTRLQKIPSSRYTSMPQTKEQKKKALLALKEKIQKQKAMFFVDFSGFKVKDMSSLRKKIRGVDGEFKVAKKTLMGIAFLDQKIDVDAKKMPGEIALVMGYKDEVSPAKLVWETSKINQNLKILGGFVNNKLMTKEEVEFLAQLPGKDELLAKVVGSITAPMSGFLNVLQGNIKGLLQVLTQIKTNN